MTRYLLSIVQDPDPESPREWGTTVGKLHLDPANRYLGGLAESAPDPDGEVFLPLFAYVHGGVAVSVNPFHCPWDSGIVGAIVWAPDEDMAAGDESDDEKRELLRQEVKTLNQWLQGEVWGCVVRDAETGETLESVWGFYDEDAARAEGEAVRAALELEAQRLELEAQLESPLTGTH